VITYAVDDKQIQRDLQALIQTGGLSKKYAKMSTRAAADVIDDKSRAYYGSAAYRYGSSKSSLRGNSIRAVGKKITFARQRFRLWAKKKSSLRFQAKKHAKTNFWYRSMVRRTNSGRGNPSTLAHLVEDGAMHWKTGRKTFAWDLRRRAFRENRRAALAVLERGISYSMHMATRGTQMGLVKFRKSVTKP